MRIKIKFCINCGSPFHTLTPKQKSSISSSTSSISRNVSTIDPSAGNYRPTRTISHLKYDEWEDSSLISTTVKLYVNPGKTAPSILMSENSPSPLVYVTISTIIGIIVSVIITIKINQASDGLAPVGDTGFPTYFAFQTIAGPFLGYFIGSAVVSAILKNDFHVASEQHIKSDQIFRRLWGYIILVNAIFSISFIPIALNITASAYETTDYTGKIYTVVNISSSFHSSVANLVLISSFIMMALFVRVVSSLDYEGNSIFVVCIIWLIIIIVNYTAYSRVY